MIDLKPLGATARKRGRRSHKLPCWATVLYQACNCEDQKFGLGAIRCLLEAGANIDQKVLHGQLVETPLSTSLDWLRYDSVDWDDTGLSYVSLLLRYGPDLDECWCDDKSAEDCLRQHRGSRAPSRS